jgi:hypothetical protein
VHLLNNKLTKVMNSTDPVISASRGLPRSSQDKKLALRDLDNGRELVSFLADFRITTCTVAADGRTVLAGDESGEVHFLAHESTRPGPPRDKQPF